MEAGTQRNFTHRGVFNTEEFLPPEGFMQKRIEIQKL